MGLRDPGGLAAAPSGRVCPSPHFRTLRGPDPFLAPGPPCAPRPAPIPWVVPVRGLLLCSPVSSSITASASLVRTTEAHHRISANEGSSTQDGYWALGACGWQFRDWNTKPLSAGCSGTGFPSTGQVAQEGRGQDQTEEPSGLQAEAVSGSTSEIPSRMNELGWIRGGIN